MTGPVDEYIAAGWWNDRVLADGLELAAVRRPSDLALADDRQRLTWSEFAGAVAGATKRLEASRLGPDAAVVLVTGNTVDGVVAYHGLLRAAVTTVVLDRRCGPADLRAALETLPVSLVVVPESERSRLTDTSGSTPVIAVEELVDLVRPSGQAWAGSEPDRQGSAVVLFTSGTTSRPKAVVHSLNTLTAGAHHMALTTGADENSVLYLVSPVASITGIMQMHLSADCHCTLVLDDDFDPVASLDRINSCHATLLGGAPVIVERLIAVADTRPAADLSLRTLALGGSMLSRRFLEGVADRYGIDIVRVYGSSEAPNSTGRHPGALPAEPLRDDGALMPGTEVKVGSPGHAQEGLVRGPAVMLGYLDREDNAAAFEDGWYRTGDLVEVTDGRLTVLGRLKEIVNRNGFKISLSEIDAALSDLAGCAEAASFGVPDSETGEHLAVAVVSDGSSPLAMDHVLSHLRAAGLAVRKLPEQVVIWDTPLPRTASGKIIRSQLAMDAPSKPSSVVDRLQRPANDQGPTAIDSPVGESLRP